jgi:hypothetical protein
MQNLKARLERLEAKTPTQREPIIINRFFVCPGRDEEEVTGYESNCGITTLRLPDESLDDLRKRCGQLPIPTTRRLFSPLFKNDLN